MTKINKVLFWIIQNLSKKLYQEMTKEEREWNDICTFIVPYIAQKYSIFPEIIHHQDDKNTKDSKFMDFEFKTHWIDEIPFWDYEHTLVCGIYDKINKTFSSLSKKELLSKIDDSYRKKTEKNYSTLNWIKWLIFSGMQTNSKFQPLHIFENFRAQQGNFDTLIFIWFRNEKNSFLLIYQKKLDIGYEIKIESQPDKFIIHKDIKINFLTETFHDRILKN